MLYHNHLNTPRKSNLWVKIVSVVKVDAHRRIYIPSEIPIEADKVIIVPQGAAYLLVPVPKEPIEIDVKTETKQLKAMAELKAKKDAAERARRREKA